MPSLRNDIDHTIVAYPFSHIYRMHKYWSRKPANVVAKYISAYTDEGDIILDPFVGSGVTAIEALRLGRKIVAVDLNPMAVFITRTTLRPVSLVRLCSAFEQIRASVEARIAGLYSTRCEKCGAVAQGLVYRRHSRAGVQVYGVEKGCPDQELVYECRCTRRQLRKRLDSEDHDRLLSLNDIDIPYWHPGEALLRPIKSGQPKLLSQFFTRRNLYALSLLNSAISEVEDSDVRDALKLAFTSSIAQSSELTGADRRGPDGWSATAWIVPDFRILQRNVERNVWRNFDSRFQAVRRGKQESNKYLSRYHEATSFRDLVKSDANALIIQGDARDLQMIPDSSVDYVLTDPPYEGSLHYMSLSSLWAHWLRMPVEHTNEIVASGDQNSRSDYQEKLSQAVGEAASKLKRSRYAHLFFRTAKPEYWPILANMGAKAGLSIQQVVYQTLRYSFSVGFRGRKPDTDDPDAADREMLGAGSLGDYVFRFQKNEPKVSTHGKGLAERIADTAREVILHRNEPTPLVYLISEVYNQLGTELCGDPSTDPLTIIKAEIGHSLIVSRKAREGVSGISLWDWVDLQEVGSSRQEGSPTTTDRVKDTVVSIVTQRPDASIFYILQGVLQRLKGRDTVGGRTISRVLQEHFSFDSEQKRWVLSARDCGLEHARLVHLAAGLGRRHGFGVYVGSRKQADCSYQGRPLDWGAVVTAQRDDLPSLLQTSSRVDDIDVLWLRDGKPCIYIHVLETGDIGDDALCVPRVLEQAVDGLRTIAVVPHHSGDAIRAECPSWYALYIHDLEKSLCGLDTYEPDSDLFDAAGCSPTRQHRSIARRATVLEKPLLQSHDRGLCKLVLDCPDAVRDVEPGMFFQFACDNGHRERLSRQSVVRSYGSLANGANNDSGALHTMRIPVSVHRIYYQGFDPAKLPDSPIPAEVQNVLHAGYRTKMDIVFRVVGDATAALADKVSGDKLDLIGPLGKPAEISKSTDVAILVAGGIGFAPLYPVAENMRSRGKRVVLLFGVRSREDFPVDSEQVVKDDFGKIGVRVRTVFETEEGRVTKALDDSLREELAAYPDQDPSRICVYCCGPWRMMAEVHRICAAYNGVPCKAFLEKRMYCGVGACMSCVCKIHNRGTQTASARSSYKCVCTEGPVFDAYSVDWEDEDV